MKELVQQKVVKTIHNKHKKSIRKEAREASKVQIAKQESFVTQVIPGFNKNKAQITQKIND
jgi:hypothetical protein